jgi:glycerophosphoryl diester phosphodiesterase
MIVLAHRANWAGGNLAAENSLRAVRYCLEQGWGIEIDIRRSIGGDYYISHDVAAITKSNQANTYCSLFRRHPDCLVAMNIKELGYEADLLDYLVRHRVLQQLFLFDMELLESQPGETARLFRQLCLNVKLAARVSDHGEPIERALRILPAEVMWVDEFDSLWTTQADIRRLKAANKTVYVVSPEIHDFSLSEMERRWRQLHAWGVDGICTDYAEKLAGYLATGFVGQSG